MKIIRIFSDNLKTIIAFCFIIMFLSCESNQNKIVFKKFVFAQIKGVKTDSLGNPSFRLVSYLEIDSSNSQKFAYSSSDGKDNELDRYYIFNKSSYDIIDSINKYFMHFSNDSMNEIKNIIESSLRRDTNEYESMDYIYSYIISYVTNDEKRKDFYFDKPTYAIEQIVKNLEEIKNKNIPQTRIFEIDKRYKFIEENIFKAFPPPPTILTNEAKFERPE